MLKDLLSAARAVGGASRRIEIAAKAAALRSRLAPSSTVDDPADAEVPVARKAPVPEREALFDAGDLAEPESKEADGGPAEPTWSVPPGPGLGEDAPHVAEAAAFEAERPVTEEEPEEYVAPAMPKFAVREAPVPKPEGLPDWVPLAAILLLFLIGGGVLLFRMGG